MPLDLDPRFTFEAFVVGPANRLGVAAARRVADAPAATYNPLFIYSGSGLGKTHLLGAIGQHVERIHDTRVVYETTEHLMEVMGEAVEAGDRDVFRGRLHDAGILLLDDVQFLAGRRQVQEELLRAWDALARHGAQVVLTSDRPPHEIDGLDDRLLDRLSGGLIVDMSPPDYETRIAIARRKAEERGSSLAPGVFHALARIAFTNVRELQGALNRLIAVQELEGRPIMAGEVKSLLGTAADRGADEFGEFLFEITGTVSEVVEEGERHVADAILAWEGEGYRTRRLESALSGDITEAEARELVRHFERDVQRLKEIAGEIGELDPDAPEGSNDLLRDPDRVTEAEALLDAVRERTTPPPGPPAGPGLDALDDLDALAVRVARKVAERPGSAYNPLYILGPEGSGRTTLLVAVARTLQELHGLSVAFVEGDTFAEELIDALERSRLGAWRARYRRAGALVLDDVDRLAGLERGHEELFHLFEELHREGRQLVFSAAVPPQELPMPARLQSRFEGGLVVELRTLDDAAEEATPARAGAAEEDAAAPGEDAAPEAGEALPEPETAGTSAGAPAVEAAVGADGAPSPRGREAAGRGTLSPEKVLWEWPYPRDWIQESVD